MHPALFVLTAFVAFFGLFVGSFVSHVAKDEVHEFKHWLPFLQLLCFILFFIVLYLFFPFLIISIFLILSLLIIYLFWKKNNLNFLDFIIFAALFAFSSSNIHALIYNTIILFVFSFFSGVLYYVLHTKPATKHSKESLHVGYNKHSNRFLPVSVIYMQLFYDNIFFFILTIVTYIFAQLATFIF